MKPQARSGETMESGKAKVEKMEETLAPCKGRERAVAQARATG